MEEFLKELSELSKKHGLYIRARHETDDWYSPLLIDSEKGSGAKIIAEALYWNETENTYTVEILEGIEDNLFRR